MYKYKKIISSFLIFILTAVTLTTPISAGALSADGVSAPSAILMEASTGKIIFEKNT